MVSSTQANSVIGILGGGQLSRMLLQAATRLGIRALALVESNRSPAARLGAETRVGRVADDLDSLGTLGDFLEACGTTIFENEFVDCRILAAVSMETGTRFVPPLSTLVRLQDKISQKEALAALGLSFVRYQIIDAADPEFSIRSAFSAFPEGLVLKWSRFGYDGYGNRVYARGSSPAGAVEFCRKAWERGSAVYAEEFVDFRRELAITVCHSRSGDLRFYPLVITEQSHGACHWVRGAATALGVDARLETQAHRIAESLALKLPLHGVFSVEFFETAQGELRINELAPRVHNSAHYSIDACRTSQFENHLRAALGWPLGPVDAAPFFAMLNLLVPKNGDAAKLATLPPSPPVGIPEGVVLHWYEKDRLTPGRKMGHLSAAARDARDLEELVGKMKSLEERWLANLGK